MINIEGAYKKISKQSRDQTRSGIVCPAENRFTPVESYLWHVRWAESNGDNNNCRNPVE